MKQCNRTHLCIAGKQFPGIQYLSLSLLAQSINYQKDQIQLKVPSGSVYIVIDKSDYELSVYDYKGWYATYPVVFGNNSLDDKKMEGDKNTPEGSFRIANKRVHDKWYRFLGHRLSYAGKLGKIQKKETKGEIPASARIGGGIGIHGTWPNEDFVSR